LAAATPKGGRRLISGPAVHYLSRYNAGFGGRSTASASIASSTREARWREGVERRHVNEDEAIDRLCADFRGDFCERIKLVKLCCKGDLDGDDDGRLWHFTRLSILQNILARREIWLSDLAYSNDENEVVYGLGRAKAVINEISKHWSNRKHAETVIRLVKRAQRRFKKQFHIYAFSLSTEHDTVQHWHGYGGGLYVNPKPDDPYVAVGFDATALFHPLELSSDEPPIYAINTVSGDEFADTLVQYWAIKTRAALEILDNPRTPIAAGRVNDLFEHMLVLACSLVKNTGWRDENEYRLLYITESFGDEQVSLPRRPDGHGRYVPLRWEEDRSPIRAVIPHPLAMAAFVRKSLQASKGGKKILIRQSELKPRRKE
jgi:hypothetical protein